MNGFFIRGVGITIHVYKILETSDKLTGNYFTGNYKY